MESNHYGENEVGFEGEQKTEDNRSDDLVFDPGLATELRRYDRRDWSYEESCPQEVVQKELLIG